METLIKTNQDILENKFLTNMSNVGSYDLYKDVENFIRKYNIINVLISLSGGVDSMVLLEIIRHIKISNMNDLNIYCCHINYNNREESVKEKDFLYNYCKLQNIHFEYMDFDFKRGSIKRNDYETLTRNMRYDYYKKSIEKYDCKGVFLAHHKDDLCENIFNNIMRGSREITDLTVIRETNNILGVNVFRPMMNHFKEIIVNIAYNNNIPYFLDTTPEWSCRGKMRKNIFPACDDCYTVQYKRSLLKLGEEADILGNIVNKMIVDKIYEEIICDDNRRFIIKKNDALKEPYVMKLLMKRLCHERGIPMIKYKNIVKISNLINKETNKKHSFIKDYFTIVTNDEIIFYHT